MADSRTTFNMGSTKDEKDIFKRITLAYERQKKEPGATDEDMFKVVKEELETLFGPSDGQSYDDSFAIFKHVANEYEKQKKVHNVNFDQIFQHCRTELVFLFFGTK
jgi:hypothetical protein